MTDKTKLIESMTNLIQHVSTNRKNQEQIFATLSTADVRKILSNLDDTNQKLRKTTLLLLAELLYQNVSLQKKFCQLTGISYFPGIVVLTSNFPKAILNDAQALIEVVKIIKQNSTQKQRGLFWYIDAQSKPKTLQIGRRNSYLVDPINCIYGVWMCEDEITNSKHSIQNNSHANSQSNSINKTIVHKNYQNVYIQSSPQRIEVKNTIASINGKVRLNRSEHIQKNYDFSFKPQTPLKSSLNVDQHIVTRTRQNNTQSWVPSTPIQIKSQIKSISQTEPSQSMGSTDRKNYHPSISTFDSTRYIKNNNFMMAPMTTTHKVEQPRSKESSLTNSIYVGQTQNPGTHNIMYGFANTQGMTSNPGGQPSYYRYDHHKH